MRGGFLKTLALLPVALLLAGCAQVALVVGDHPGERRELLWGDGRLGQTFVSSDRNLTRIDVYFYRSPKSSRDRGSVTLKLYSRPDRMLLAEAKRPVAKVDTGWQRFSFDPIRSSKKKILYLELEAPNLTRASAVAVSAAAGDPYRDGRAFADGRPLDDLDLKFKPFIMMDARMLVNSVGPRLVADPAFMVVWLMMLLATLFGLAVLRRRPG